MKGIRYEYTTYNIQGKREWDHWKLYNKGFKECVCTELVNFSRIGCLGTIVVSLNVLGRSYPVWVSLKSFSLVFEAFCLFPLRVKVY